MTTAADILRLRDEFRNRRRMHESDLDYQLAKLKKKVVKRADRMLPGDIAKLNEKLGRWFHAFGVACVWSLVACLGIEALVQAVRLAKWAVR